jgi:undecaprenyl pyrophosphate phosphatase UppP
MEKLLNPPEKQKVPLLIAATVAFVVLFIAINWILNIAADKFYFAFFA